MSPRPIAGRSSRAAALVAVVALAALGDLAETRAQPAAGATPSTATRADERTALIVRVRVNTVVKGDIAILMDARGHALLPRRDYLPWGLPDAPATIVDVDGEPYVDVAAVPGVTAAFDPRAVTLDLSIAPATLPATTIDLGPARRTGVRFPSDPSVFFNYGVNASGDDALEQRQYQFATEVGARYGDWLVYNTTSQQWGEGAQNGFVRLLTNVQLDDRPNLRRWTFGDYFTPSFDLNASVPMAGISLTKFYSMDPYFVQYPTAAFRTEVAFPSTVQVRIDGNLVAQRQVQPGPVDITNITNGLTGGQNVSVVLRDPFGREQVLSQPFFFATSVGLAQGLHEYSYNLGLVRRQYGIESNDYGDLGASAFHRYAFTDALTLGARGQATRDLYNIGPFATWQSRFGIVAGGVALGGRDAGTGAAGSAAYSYTGTNYSVNLGALYRAQRYAELADLTTDFRVRSNQYASGSLYSTNIGTLTATYSALTSYDGPDAKLVNVSYTRSMLEGRGLLSVNYIRTQAPQVSNTWLVSFRYFLDALTSVVGGLGGSGGGSSQSLSLQRSIPQGEGIGYEATAAHFAGDVPDAMSGRAFVQANTALASVGAEYERASRSDGGRGLSRVFVAGSIGAVGGRVFASRPVQDSFALVRVPDLPGVPVYANGWFVGHTDERGEAVATNIASYYDNFVSFGTRELPLDYVFPTSEIVISPMTRSGSLVEFAVRKNYAVAGLLVATDGGVVRPLEFREIALVRGDATVRSFTARRGEFYVEGVTPGEYLLRLETGEPCTARLTVPPNASGTTDVGTVVCTR